MTDADLIWNRAALEDGGESPARGDVALASLLAAHGFLMNGGVLHTVEVLDADSFAKAQDGYRFFGLGAVAKLLGRARRLVDRGRETEADEAKLDAEYGVHIPNDGALAERFERHLRAHPRDFTPL